MSPVRSEVGDPQAEPSEEVLFEDDSLRVLRVSLPSGASFEAANPQLDQWLCVIDGGRAMLTGPGTTVLELTYARGQSAYLRGNSNPHQTVTNRGQSVLRFLRIELK